MTSDKLDEQKYMDELNDFMCVLEGKKYSLVLTHDQRVRAGYVKEAANPCMFCDGKSFVVGKFQVPPGLRHVASYILYSVCEPCFKRGDVQNKAKSAILESLEEGLIDVRT